MRRAYKFVKIAVTIGPTVARFHVTRELGTVVEAKIFVVIRVVTGDNDALVSALFSGGGQIAVSVLAVDDTVETGRKDSWERRLDANTHAVCFQN